MVSIESVKNLLDEAKGQLLVLMQEGDEGGLPLKLEDWAEEMYQAWQHATEALHHVQRAELYQ